MRRRLPKIFNALASTSKGCRKSWPSTLSEDVSPRVALRTPRCMETPASSGLAQHCDARPWFATTLAFASFRAARAGVPEASFLEDGMRLKASLSRSISGIDKDDGPE
ncbi:hypothetical protein ACLOJK_037584 [Asimina triloba]